MPVRDMYGILDKLPDDFLCSVLKNKMQNSMNAEFVTKLRSKQLDLFYDLPTNYETHFHHGRPYNASITCFKPCYKHRPF